MDDLEKAIRESLEEAQARESLEEAQAHAVRNTRAIRNAWVRDRLPGDADTLTISQVNAITHAWLEFRVIKEHLEAPDEFVGVGAGELLPGCEGRLEELEQEFPFLLEGVKDE